jgi:Txe/YoeB family toxin of Txe-Axe toxin-antitoxin module
VEWLVPVWQSGLRTIIELPFAGYYARRVDREHMLVSRTTRNDPELYSLALSTM